MKKFFKYALGAVVALAVLFGAYALFQYVKGPQYAVEPAAIPESELGIFISDLNHDIHVNEPLTCIYDGEKTGFDVTVGPTGWPVGSDVKWEVALYEGSDAYYARLVFHEYMMWWSWDNPYLAVKIPKANVTGDPMHDEKFRWQMLWDITHATSRSYDYSPYITRPQIRNINGHTVYFAKWGCHYEKYLVLSDASCDW